MPVEHISLMPVSCLSLTNTRQDTRQYGAHYGSANQEFADAGVRRNQQRGVLIAGVLYHFSPIPIPFLLSPYPLPLSTPSPFFLPVIPFAEEPVLVVLEMGQYFILCSRKFVN